MKLKIRSVIEKKPPIGETLLYWGTVEDPYASPRMTEACIAIVPKEELEFVSDDVSNEMVWSHDQEGFTTEMGMDDLWSPILERK